MNAEAFYLRATPLALFLFFSFFGNPGLNPVAFYLRATPPALFFFLCFILKLGLMRLRRASLRRERERERERGRERAEAGCEPGSSGLRLPKYWDYKRAPPRPALS